MTKVTKEEFYGTKKQTKVLDNTGPLKQGAGGSSAPLPPPKKKLFCRCALFFEEPLICPF